MTSEQGTTTVTSLKQLRGVGQSTAERLIDVYGSEEKALQAIREADISGLSRIEGIGEKLAVRLVRTLHTMETGEKIDDFLRTRDAEQLYLKCREIIAEFGNTLYSKSKTYLWFPLPRKSLEKIIERQQHARDSLALVRILSPYLSQIDALLSKLRPLKEQETNIDVGSRVILYEDEKVESVLEKYKIVDHCEVARLESPDELLEYSQIYDEVIFISDDDYHGIELPNVVTISSSGRFSIEQILPERILAFYAINRESILAITSIANILSNISDSKVNEFMKGLNLEILTEMQELIMNLQDTGEPDPRMDSEYQRLSQAVSQLDTEVSETEISINDRLNSEIRQVKLELEGERILELLKTSDLAETADDNFSQFREVLLDQDLAVKWEEIISTEEEKLIKRLRLLDEEEELIQGLFMREISFPVKINEEILEKLRRHLKKKLAIRSYELKTRLASALSPHKDHVVMAARRFFELDFALMLGKFIDTYQMTFPTLKNDPSGIKLDGLKNLFLQKLELEGKLVLEPVSYSLGEIGTIQGVVNGERICILSGANSGGKTTLLVAVAQAVILGQMGLAVPASHAEIGVFDELHFFKKATGEADAGAFESTLRTLTGMVLKKTRKLVLADEMESISEPGASARVISAFLDMLYQSEDSCGLFVSHLANEIAEHCKNPVRIDGIEAKGLDQNLNLIVDRSPKFNYYARSTPQLIVERLQKLSTGRETEIYSEILNRFSD